MSMAPSSRAFVMRSISPSSAELKGKSDSHSRLPGRPKVTFTCLVNKLRRLLCCLYFVAYLALFSLLLSFFLFPHPSSLEPFVTVLLILTPCTMDKRLRKKVSKYFTRFLRDRSAERPKTAPAAPAGGRERSPDRPPNRIVVNLPEVPYRSNLPNMPGPSRETATDSLGGETSTSSNPFSGETHDKSGAEPRGKEMASTPVASELLAEENMGLGGQTRAADNTVTLGLRYSVDLTAANKPRETGKARLLKPITVAANSYQHAIASSTQSCEIGSVTRSDGTSLQPIGKWGCCKCKRSYDIYYFTDGEHPVSILNCECTHRSCGKCSLEGQMKVFQPMCEPEVVQLTEDDAKQIRFGVFCDGCGVSWRAVEVVGDTEKKTIRQQISGLPKHIIKHANPMRKPRQEASMADLSLAGPSEGPMTLSSSLNLRELSNEMEAEGHGKQADLATVRFTGITCLCGLVTDSTCLCFQVVDPPKDVFVAQFEELMAAPRKVAGFGTTPEDQARGHQTPTLTLRERIQHPNPLRSCPAIDE
ncbi:predicted protein [Plenodomus lingam JN3]|uniref:Probable double zinc ribbon domain-containing protein n=2 Tax=Leptosphaeria maculans TaxID=5022 RepID=E4ZGB8_LEPMJ|nr:predicted protein [Plenodomus lingam JN3]CBX90338.1 predicted protein [Plenodomus lingam JN3]